MLREELPPPCAHNTVRATHLGETGRCTASRQGPHPPDTTPGVSATAMPCDGSLAQLGAMDHRNAARVRCNTTARRSRPHALRQPREPRLTPPISSHLDGQSERHSRGALASRSDGPSQSRTCGRFSLRWTIAEPPRRGASRRTVARDHRPRIKQSDHAAPLLVPLATMDLREAASDSMRWIIAMSCRLDALRRTSVRNRMPGFDRVDPAGFFQTPITTMDNRGGAWLLVPQRLCAMHHRTPAKAWCVTTDRRSRPHALSQPH
ncbi:hypothetical protein N9L68_08680 [bacterium]|nr:hypothetical protein [bacterium]